MLSRHIKSDHENDRISMPMFLFEQIIGFDHKWGWKHLLDM